MQHAIMAGDEITGASTFLLEAGLDTGPVFGTVTEAIGPRDTAGDLLGRLAVSGAGLLVATLDGIAAGTLVAEPQPAEGISLAPQDRAGRRADRLVAARLRRRPAGPRGDPGPRRLDDVARGAAAAGPGASRCPRSTWWPPASCEVGPEGVLVGTGRGAVRLGDVQPAGKRMFPAADWARGARPQLGERVGE